MVCLNFSFLLFIIGIVGIIWNKKSFVLMLLCIELMFFAISLNFIYFSLFTFNISGQVFALFIVTTAATETAIGLSLIVISYRLGDKLDYNSLISFMFIKKKKIYFYLQIKIWNNFNVICCFVLNINYIFS